MESALLTLTWLCVVGVQTGAWAEARSRPHKQSKFPRENGVLILGDDNFDAALKTYHALMVDFYAPWCSHCRSFSPEYEKAAKMLQEDDHGLGIRLAKVNGHVYTKLADRLAIDGYPTQKFFKAGILKEEYGGDRSAEAIYEWMIQKSTPSATYLTTTEEAEEFLAEHENLALIGFFTGLQSEPARAYMKCTEFLKETPFAITTRPAVAKAYGINIELGSDVVLFKNCSERRNTYTGEYNESNIKPLLRFIGIYSLPLLIEFNDNTAKKVFGSPANMRNHFFYVGPSNGTELVEHLEMLETLAEAIRGDVFVITIDTSDDRNAHALKYFGLSDPATPVVRMISIGEDGLASKYKPKVEEVTEDGMIDFLWAVLDGDIEAYLNSAEPPEDWNKGPVKEIVGKTYQELVVESEQPVFVFFYSPTSTQYQEIISIWEKLAKHYEPISKVWMVKINGMLNEAAGVDYEEFPHFLFYRAGEKHQPVVYKGEADFDLLKEFIDTNGGEVAKAEFLFSDALPVSDNLYLKVLGFGVQVKDENSIVRDEL